MSSVRQLQNTPGLLKSIFSQNCMFACLHVCVSVCLSTHVSKQTFKTQNISLYVINEVRSGFLHTVSVMVNEGGVSQH